MVHVQIPLCTEHMISIRESRHDVEDELLPFDGAYTPVKQSRHVFGDYIHKAIGWRLAKLAVAALLMNSGQAFVVEPTPLGNDVGISLMVG